MTTRPSAEAVHVWRFDLDREDAHPELLSPDEHARKSRFHFERDARRWAAGRSLLRRTLGGYLGAEPNALLLDTGPWGKPCLRDSPLRFNVAHSGSVCLMAFAWNQEVGIDVECRRRDFVPEDLAAQVLSLKEQDALCLAAPAERHDLFLSLWTAKEASVKVLGVGLSFPLPLLTLSLVPSSDRYEAEDLTLTGALTGVSVCRLPFLPGFAASLAAAGAIADIQYFDHFYAP